MNIRRSSSGARIRDVLLVSAAPALVAVPRVRDSGTVAIPLGCNDELAFRARRAVDASLSVAGPSGGAP